MKPILDDALLAQLTELLERGDMTVTQAAEKAGVRGATLRAWLSYGARATHLLETLVRASTLVRARAVGVERAARAAQELVRASELAARRAAS